jgi:hypothetical protein
MKRDNSRVASDDPMMTGFPIDRRYAVTPL